MKKMQFIFIGVITFFIFLNRSLGEWNIEQWMTPNNLITSLNAKPTLSNFKVAALQNSAGTKIKLFYRIGAAINPADWKWTNFSTPNAVVSFLNQSPALFQKITTPRITAISNKASIRFDVYYRVASGSPEGWSVALFTNKTSPVIYHINSITNTEEQIAICNKDGLVRYFVFSRPTAHDTTTWVARITTNLNDALNALNGKEEYINNEFTDFKVESEWRNGLEQYYFFTKTNATKLTYTRELYGIKDGILNPVYMGGLLNPCPEVADINGDGRKDIIIGDDDRVECFLNMSSNAPFFSRWKYEPNIFPNLTNTIRAVPRLVDIDNDNDLDLFVGKIANYINVPVPATMDFYENQGTATNPIFPPLPTEVDYAGVEVASEAIPAFADIDSDGDYDLCVGEEYDPLWLYRNVGTSTAAAWSFDGIAPGLEYTDESAYPTFGDLDNDGDLDVVIGNAHGHSKFHNNNGTTNQPFWEYVPTDLDYILYGGSREGKRSVLVDLDNDTDLDLIMCNYQSPYFIQNTGTLTSASWSIASRDNIYFDWSQWSGVECHDLNGDGKKDLLSADFGGISFYQNSGTTSSPNWVRNQTPFQMIDQEWIDNHDLIQYSGDIAVGDIDADGDKDFYIGRYYNYNSRPVYFIENIGTAQNPVFSTPQNDLINVYNQSRVFISPALVDIDADADLDMFIGSQDSYNGTNGSLAFIRNIGTPQNAVWSLVTTNYNNINIPGCAPTFHDIDLDGDYDLFIGSKQGAIWAYRNIGNATTAVWSLWSPNWKNLNIDAYSRPTFTDLDGNGVVDMLCGGEKGGVRYWKGSLNTF